MAAIKGAERVQYSSLLQEVSKLTGVKISDVRRVVQALLVTLSKGLAAGAIIPLGRMGTLRTIVAKARKARNPRTGEVFDVPDRTKVRFKAGETLTRIIAGEIDASAAYGVQVTPTKTEKPKPETSKPKSRSKSKAKAKSTSKSTTETDTPEEVLLTEVEADIEFDDAELDVGDIDLEAL